jgi:hypothetical protein
MTINLGSVELRNIKITEDQFNHIIAALELMKDIDRDNGRENDAKESQQLIHRLQYEFWQVEH